MKKILILIFALFIIIKQIFAGHIESWDIETVYNYNGKAIKFGFIFRLESGLGSNDIILLELPFNLGIASNVLGLLQEYETNI